MAENKVVALNLGPVTSYGLAKSKGFPGTEEAWVEKLMANATEEAVEAVDDKVDALDAKVDTQVETINATIEQEVGAVDTKADGIDANLTTLSGVVAQKMDTTVAQASFVPVPSASGAQGDALRNNGDGTTAWAPIGLPTDEQTSTAINAWLTAHPEATTTVQDGAITRAKLITDLQEKTDLAQNATAPAFDATVAYTPGAHVTYGGKLYVLPSGHEANVTWADTTKNEVNLGGEVADLKSAFTLSVADEKTLLDYTTTAGKFIKYLDGMTVDSSTFSATSFIPVKGLSCVLYKKVGSTSSSSHAGIAFYDEDKEFVSGFQGVLDQSADGYVSELIAQVVPSDAYYVRFSVFTDTVTHGAFEAYGISKAQSHVDKSNNTLYRETGEKVSTITKDQAISVKGASSTVAGRAATGYINGAKVGKAFSVNLPGFLYRIWYYTGLTAGTFVSYDSDYHSCDGKIRPIIDPDLKYRLCFYHDPVDSISFTDDEIERIRNAITLYDYAQNVTDENVSVLKDVTGTNALVYEEEKKYYDTSGEIGSVVDLNSPVASSYTNCIVTTCSPGENFTISGFGTNGARLYAFLDSDNRLLENAPPFACCTDRIIKAPANSAKLIIHNNTSTGVSVMIQYRGANSEIVNKNSSRSYSTAVPHMYWRNGGIDGDGFNDSATNKRSDGIMFNPGEHLVITNTNKNVRMAVYAVSGNSFNIVGFGGYVDGGSRVELKDWTKAYYIRLAPYGSDTTRPDPNAGGYIQVAIDTDSEPYLKGNYKHASYPQIGLHRTYVNIKPVLTFEHKNISESGIEDSTNSCLVTLPNCGWVEVRQDGQSVQFKIAKVTNGIVSFPVNEWSYYFHRYEGDGESQYYALVTESPGASDAMDIVKRTKLYLGIYLYTDEGAKYDYGYYLSGKKLAFIGDSITQGRFDKDHDSGHSIDTSTSKAFCEFVAEVAGDDNVGIFGIGGACVTDAVGSSWKSLIANCQKVTGYDVVFVCGGTNDYGSNAPEADFRTDYAQVLDTLASNNTEVICCTPIYRTSKKGANTVGLWLTDYAGIIKEIANEKGLKCIDLLSLTSDGLMARFCPDGLHPNEMGHMVMADWIVKECDRLGL